MRRLLIAGVLLAACSALAPSAAAAAPPRWQTVPGHGEGFRGAWAVDRAWLFKDGAGNASGDEIEIRSAPIGASRLGSWVTQRLPDATTYLRVIGDSLFYVRPDGTLRFAALHADGSIGPPEAVAGAPPDGPPPAPLSPHIVRLPDRVVWVVEARDRRRFGCCNGAGAAVEYSSFLPPSLRTGGRFALGRDAAGRLWFAWIQSGRATGPVKAIELATDTLQPIGSPLTSPLPKSVSIVGMPCEASCYLVTETARGKAYSWRPGAASPTLVPTPSRSTPGYGRAGIVAVDSFGGRMLFAYWADSTERGVRIRLARGNARGAHPRILRTIYDPSKLGLNVFSTGPPRGIVGPRGAVVFQQYENFATGRPFLRAAFLRR